MTRIVFGSVGFLVLATIAASQPPGPGARRGPAWDPATVETVSGEVVRVDRVPSPRGRGHGVHLVVQRDGGGTVAVHLGPASWMDAQGLRPVPKDRIRVTGSRVDRGGTAVILAATVQLGDRTVVLRDAAGVPAWSGGPRGPGKVTP